MHRHIRRTIFFCFTIASIFAHGAMSTSGQFAVSPSGAANYSIPIQIPPGIAGIEPKLALTYNSQSGNGLLGMGWSLSGLSAISRCPQTMAQDGVRGSVNFDASDRFCLDGRRLLAVSGAYGGNATEYRTEQEGFTKIVSYGTAGNGPASFKVWTKSGQVMEYGNTTDSRVEAQGRAMAGVWAVNRLQDTKGNYFTVTYTEDSANGDYYPQRIDYTGNATTGTTPNNSVQFIYAARSDVTVKYHAGSMNKNTVRLANVKTYTSTSLTKDYRLAYGYGVATGRSKLETIVECTADDTCFPATNLTWQTGSTSLATAVESGALTGSELNGWRHFLGDFNGDGKTDMAAVYVGASGLLVQTSLGNGDGTFQLAQASGGLSGSVLTGWLPQLGDFNGDGKLDVAAVYVGDSGMSAQISFGNGDATFQTVQSTGNLSGSSLSGWTPVASDFDGDGRTDLAAIYVGASGFNAQIAISLDGVAFQTAQGNNLMPGSNLAGYTMQLGDFNGDGRVDVAAVYAGSSGLVAHVSFSAKSGMLNSAVSSGHLSGSVLTSYLPVVGDFNGDGKADVCAVYIGESGMLAQIAFGSGDGTFQPAINSAIFSASPLAGYTLQLGDFNSDGRLDLAAVYMGASGFAAVISFMQQDGTPQGGQMIGGLSGSNLSGYTPKIADINGDGKADLIATYVGSAGLNAQSVIVNPAQPDLVSIISNGLGATMSIVYKPLTDSSAYAKDSGANASSYPVIDIQTSMHVVSSMASSNGIGGIVTTNYTYGGLKADLTGRGLLGFRWTQSVQAETGLTSRTEYRQDWPYTGSPSLMKKTLAGGGNSGLLSQVTNTYACSNPSGGACTVAAGQRYFPFISQSSSTSWDLNGTALPGVTTSSQYDSYGNPTQIVVTTGDGFSKITTNIYTNDITNWFLGRLTRATVTSAAP